MGEGKPVEHCDTGGVMVKDLQKGSCMKQPKYISIGDAAVW